MLPGQLRLDTLDALLNAAHLHVIAGQVGQERESQVLAPGQRKIKSGTFPFQLFPQLGEHFAFPSVMSFVIGRQGAVIIACKVAHGNVLLGSCGHDSIGRLPHRQILRAQVAEDLFKDRILERHPPTLFALANFIEKMGRPFARIEHLIRPVQISSLQRQRTGSRPVALLVKLAGFDHQLVGFLAVGQPPQTVDFFLQLAG